ncbi:peptidoglycan D,D-transpeptidase FtsI family protein [Caminibacter sp.]
MSVAKPKHYFEPETKQTIIAMRGNILTKNYILAKSEKIYGVYLYPEFLNKNRLSLFYSLFSIYSDIPVKKLITTIQKGELEGKKRILLAKVDLKTKQNLIYLNKVLDKKGVYKSNKYGFRRGLEIVNLDFQRDYPYGDVFEPFLGRYRKDIKRGVNGIEEFYDYYLKARQNGIKKGYRDVLGNIIYDGNSVVKQPLNGHNLKLNINLALQREIEKLLDIQKEKLQAREVIAAVMDSKTGKILAIATSNRYNPLHITKKDIPNMKISAVREIFEPGSVLKPITLAILLELNKANPYEMINTENGVWKPKWRKTPIRDDEKFQSLSVTDIIVHSSNIGISKLALRLTGKEEYEGLSRFGLNSKSGIDLPYEVTGRIRPVRLLNYEVYRTTTAYGYGILVNFLELLRAYNVFNNEGIMVNPKIADVPTASKRIISAKNAQIMLNILRKVVLKGTGKAAVVDGLFTAGKTGTAHVSVYKKGYQNIYNSSFFGFVNDKNRRYTIGVTFFGIKAKWPYYFASYSAVPTFKKIIDIMINENLLKVENAK